MNNEYINDLRKNVKKELTKERYRHTLGVAYTASSLAMKYGINVEKAYIAGLLHDCAKCLSDDDKLHECRRYGIEVTAVEEAGPYLLHSKLGAYYAKNKYHITDPSICNAILHHTTGKPHMSMLEKIIFIADYIEPHRDKAPNLTHLRKLAFEDTDKAVYEIIRDTLQYLEKTKQTIDETSIHTYKYYEKIVTNK